MPQMQLPKRDILTGHFRTARHVCLVAAPLGAVVGWAVAGYDRLVNVFFWDRLDGHFHTPAVLCLMPVLGLFLTGLILRLFRVSSSSMADEVVRAYHDPGAGIDYKRAIPKLMASVTTMGLGGSAGMEGASKWLGGTISSFVQERLNRVKWLRLLHGEVKTTMLAGAAAGIAAIFRAPLTGAIMGIESPYKKDLAHDALVHGLVASAVSYLAYVSVAGPGPYFRMDYNYQVHSSDLGVALLVGLACGLASHLFLALLGFLRNFFAEWRCPTLLKFVCGGLGVAAVAWLTGVVVGEPLTLQSGRIMTARLLGGQYGLWICIFLFFGKMLATCFTFGAGGVGGLFLPSAAMGAAIGAIFDQIFSASHPGVFTLVGIAAFAGASYNSLLFAVVFIAETSGSAGLVVPGLLATSVSFLVSADISNSQFQRHHADRESSSSALELSKRYPAP